MLKGHASDLLSLREQ